MDKLAKEIIKEVINLYSYNEVVDYAMYQNLVDNVKTTMRKAIQIEAMVMRNKEICTHVKEKIVEREHGNLIGTYCNKCDVFITPNQIGIKC